MFKILKFFKKIKNILPSRIIYSLFFLYIALIISAFLEMIGLGTIPVFVSILLDPYGDKEFFGINFGNFFEYFEAYGNITMLFAYFILAVYLFKFVFMFITTLFTLQISKNIKLYFSEHLLKTYIFKPYTFFVNKNSAKLSRNMTIEVSNATGFLASIINVSREISILLIIFTLLVFFDPIVSISAFILLTFLALIFYLITNKFIKKNAENRFHSIGEVFKSLFLSFGAIKDLKVYKKEDFFLEKFKKYNQIHEKNILFRDLITKLPRLIFELVGVTLVISVTFFFVYLNKDISKLLPALVLITISIIRLMPSFSSISSSLTYIKSWKNSFDLVEREISSFKDSILKNKQTGKSQNIILTDTAIDIKNLSFSYPQGKQVASIKKISMDIKKGEMVGIIGKSGAGKSTIANIILKLLSPNEGSINIYNSNPDLIGERNSHKQFIAYIPQDIFLLDDTLRRNIAFGEHDADISDTKVMDSLRGAELLDFVNKMSNGLDLIVGERGIKLSGGEKQRLGIARALYTNPEILVMDEATSSLDNYTEKQIMSSIRKLKKKHTIVLIAHRLSTIEDCDKVYLIENGEIKDFGKLQELLKRHIYIGTNKKDEK